MEITLSLRWKPFVNFPLLFFLFFDAEVEDDAAEDDAIDAGESSTTSFAREEDAVEDGVEEAHPSNGSSVGSSRLLSFSS